MTGFSPSAQAVFLDKDGTLIDDVPYNVDPARIRLARGAAEALPRLSRAGYQLIVVSNQSGVAQGYFPESALADAEAGCRACCRAILTDVGHETAWRDAPLRRPHCRAADLAEAAERIWRRQGSRPPQGYPT